MIGVLSDSHDNVNAIKRAVSLFRDAGCRLVIHAGDFVAPFAAQELAAAGCPVKAVFGNCDGEKEGLRTVISAFGEIREAPLILIDNGLRILVCHSHFRLMEYAGSGKYDVVIFGHTHKPEIKREQETLIINPGEAGGWVTGKATIALLDIKTRMAEIVSL